MKTRERGGPIVAILPAGNVAEDWLEPLSLPVADLAGRFHHAWFFAWSAALHRAGGRGVLVFVSKLTREPLRMEAPDVPTTVWILPEPRLAAHVREGISDSPSLSARLWNSPRHRSRGYLSTPVRGLAEVVRAEGCTAVVCQEYELPRFDVCVLATRRLGVPVFGTFQGTGPARTLFERNMHRLTVPRAAGLVISAPEEAERVKRRYGLAPDRIGVLPNPVDTDFWRASDRAQARAALEIGPDTQLVAWHGRVEVGTKGLDLLLHAWPQVRAAAPGADRRLVLLGNGEDGELLRALVEPVADLGVTWEPRFDPDAPRIRMLLSAADAYALTSRREGMPSAGLEAMSCGLPLVVTRAANRARILDGDEGIEVDASADAIAAGLRRLLADHELRERASAAARRHAVQRYGLDRVGPRLREFIEARSA